MKKILSLLLAFSLALSMMCITVGATDMQSTMYLQGGTNAYDLSAYGIHNFNAYAVSSEPMIDGYISSGDYPALSDTATIGDGLTLTNGAGTSDYTDEFGAAFSDFTVKSYLCYDNEYAYIAEEVTSSQEISVTTPSGSESTLSVNLRYGLNQSALLPEAVSRLSNSYSYRDLSGATTISVNSANRTYKQQKDEVSQTVTLNFDAYTSPDGTVWNTAEYAKPDNAGYGFNISGGKYTYVFEYRIPLGDLAYSATGRYAIGDVASILSRPDFHGTYMFQIAVTRTGASNQATQLFLTTGYAANKTIAPYSSASGSGVTTTWAQAVKEYFALSSGEALSVINIPSPVHHRGAYSPSATPVATSDFRPGLTGYGFNQIQSVYKAGELATFTVFPDAIENTTPIAGDLRVLPTQFRIRKGYDTKLTGTFTNYRTASFQTGKLPVGLNTVVVTFTEQRFDGQNWVDTGMVKNLSRNITIAGSVSASSTGASQTGDELAFVIGAAAVIVLLAGASIVFLKKKRVN